MPREKNTLFRKNKIGDILKAARHLASDMAVGYVLINVEPGSEFSVFQSINSIENVADATLLFGDHDILVKLEAGELGMIAKTVVEEIRQVVGVLNTKTLAGATL